jgi:hypothetical protein
MESDPNTDGEPTCGKGIAANATLPEKIAAIIRGTGEVLHNHIRSLDPGEANGRIEIEAYQRLVSEHRDLGDRLEALAALMRGYRSLPMANHDMAALMDKASLDVFVALVDREKDLLVLMQDRVKEHDEMLEAMRGR